MLSDLEVLYLARARCAEEKFRFESWRFCTCGHLYMAAEGKETNDMAPSFASDPVPGSAYASVLMTAARVLGYTGSHLNSAADYVSEATKALAPRFYGDYRDVTRKHAVELLDGVIEQLEAEYEKARLNMLAQAPTVESEREAALV